VALKGEARLLDVLLDAGGLVNAHGGIVRVRRQASNGLSDQLEIRIEDLIDRGDPAVNLPILAGDRITIPPAAEITIYFLGKGAQANSVKFKSTERVTLLSAIVRSGGLAETAARKVVIKRFDAARELREIEADYKNILDGKDPDIELQDGDIVVVKESFF
jgi:protein involved in polysaccharide export with SLBB domain